MMTCPLCSFQAKERPSSRDGYSIECRRCGEYFISRTAVVNYQNDSAVFPYVSAHTRQATEGGTRVELTTENFRNLQLAHMGTPVRRKLEMLLEYIARRSEHPGACVTIQPVFDYPLFDAISHSECHYLLDSGKEAGHVFGEGAQYGLTAKGWEAIEPPSRDRGKPGRCFVAMSFDDSLDGAYFEGIKNAVEHDCGCTAVRMKELHHNGDICDRILSEIRFAQFVVADFTKHKAGVYYEAGFARALGREVINCCHVDDFDRLHFDTNHLNHIKWATAAELREKLADRIRATIALP